MSSVFLGKPSKIISLIKDTIPKKKIESYSIMGTIVSPNKILLMCNYVRILQELTTNYRDLGVDLKVLGGLIS